MPFSNTIISLDDVDITTLAVGKYLRVRPSGNLEISQYDIPLDDLHDVESSGAYAPTTGQTLVYAADNKWRPATLDVYSVSNGLNKSGLTISVTAGSGGGLVANTSGVFISDIANVSGTYGNATHTPVVTVNSKGQITDVTPTEITTTAASSLTADYTNSITGTSGQITVTGGTGNKANAVLNLVATGVTAGVYGNTTHAPRITVDTYGRISSVDSVAVSGGGGGGGNASLGFANIHISGQTSIGAEKLEDDLTFVTGTGMSLTTTANADSISIGINPTTAAQAMSILNFSDVNASGIANGQVLKWDSTSSKFVAAADSGSGSGISLTDLSVTTASASGSGALAYNSGTGAFIFTPADLSSVTTTLTGLTDTTISSPTNGQVLKYNGTAWVNDTDAGGGAADQTLSASGNVITISGNNDTVDLTTMLAPYSKTDTDAQDLTLAGNVISLTGQSGNVDLTSVLGAINTDAQTLTWNAGTTTLGVSAGNTVDLTALSQTLSASGNVITISGSSDTVDLTTALSVYQRVDAGATANTSMKAYVDLQVTNLIGGANVNLDSLAEVANALANSNTALSTVAFTGTYSDILSRPTITLVGSDLTYDSTTIDLSGVGATGPAGSTGSTGATGNGITAVAIASNNLSLTYSNSSVQNLGNIRGPQGPAGADSSVAGPTGATGPAGSNGTNGTDGTDGADGSVDQTLSASGNVITISGNNDTVDLTTMLSPYLKAETDSQDLTLSGNIVSLSGQSGNVDLTSLLSGGGVTSLTALSDVGSDGTNGQVLTTDGSGAFTFTTVSGGASNTFGTVAVSGQTNVVADSSTDTLTLAAGSGMTITTTPGTDTITFASSGSGSGATIQRFKLNYNTSGQLATTSDLTSGITSATIDSASGGDMTITFNSSQYNYPPASLTMYGYDYTNNKYSVVPFATTMALREIAGGGSSGSPTLFDGGSAVALKLRLRETETGASRSFGTTTHAWVEFVMYD